jgi:hypothetical protein
MTQTAKPVHPGSSKRVVEPDIRRKNLNIDQRKLDQVRNLLEAKTETEAVDQALGIVLLRQELIEGVRRIAGSGGVENYFDGDSES